MKIICRYSGVEYEIFTHWRDPKSNQIKLANSFNHLTIAGEHPIFSISIPELLAEVGTSWAARKLTKKDARALFCCLLLRTELVEFRSTPAPTDATIAANMHGLARVLTWKSAIGHTLLHLPRYALTHHNRNLAFISQWIENWNSSYDGWKNNRERSLLISEAESRVHLLRKLIHSATKTTENYAGTLASWAFDASGLPNKSEGDKIIRERWMKLFRLRGLAVFQANTAHIEDMLEWFEENLEHGTVEAAKVLEHIRKILNYNTRGLEAALGFIDGSTYQIVRDNVEIHNRKAIAASAPAEEPTEAMVGNIYPTKVAMLRARAAWRIAQLQTEDTGQQIAELEKKLTSQADALLEFEEESSDSVDQLTLEFKATMQKDIGEII